MMNHDLRFSELYNGNTHCLTFHDNDEVIIKWMTDVIISEVLNGGDVLAVNGIYPYTVRMRDRVCSVLDSNVRFGSGQKGMCLHAPCGQPGSVTFVTTEELGRFPHWASTGVTLVVWEDEPYDWILSDNSHIFSDKKKVVAFSYDPSHVMDNFKSIDLTSDEPKIILPYYPDPKYVNTEYC